MANTFPIILIAASFLLISTSQSGTVDNSGISKHCLMQLFSQPGKLPHWRHYWQSEEGELMTPKSREELGCCIKECCEIISGMDSNCVSEILEFMVQEMTQGWCRVSRDQGMNMNWGVWCVGRLCNFLNFVGLLQYVVNLLLLQVYNVTSTEYVCNVYKLKY